jgi:hypothetical protein
MCNRAAREEVTAADAQGRVVAVVLAGLAVAEEEAVVVAVQPLAAHHRCRVLGRHNVRQGAATGPARDRASYRKEAATAAARQAA